MFILEYDESFLRNFINVIVWFNSTFQAFFKYAYFSSFLNSMLEVLNLESKIIPTVSYQWSRTDASNEPYINLKKTRRLVTCEI